MKILPFKLLLFFVFAWLMVPFSGQARNNGIPENDTGQPQTIVSFRFVPGDDMFYVPWNGNDAELHRLYELVDRYRTEITSGHMPVYVDAYSSSMRVRKTNLNLAFIRANRVKSELIVQKGLLEKHFITNNYSKSYEGLKDVVIVTLRIPEKVEEPKPEVRPEPTFVKEPEPVVETQPEPVLESKPVAQPTSFAPLALRTNLLYDALMAPTLGIEWRISPDLGIKLDGSFAHWGSSHGKVQKLWLISPEVRWYMGSPKQFYVGSGANIGEFNLYKYIPGNFFPDNTGYQGNLYSGGVTVGYQLPIGNCFAIDFNLGLGYTRFKYDAFYLSNEVRVYKERDLNKNFWGPTQAGISLVWRLGMKN